MLDLNLEKCNEINGGGCSGAFQAAGTVLGGAVGAGIGFWGGFGFGAGPGALGGMGVGASLGTIAGAYFCYP